MSVRVATAIEDGPCVLEVDLANTGPERRVLTSAPVVIAPPNWKSRLVLGVGVSSGQDVIPTATIGRDSRAKWFQSIDFEFARIPPGQTTLDLVWDIRAAPDDAAVRPGPLGPAPGWSVARLASRCDVSVQPASRQNLDRLAESLIRRLDNPRRTDEDIRFVLEHVRFNAHPELSRVAFALLDTPGAEPQQLAVMEHFDRRVMAGQDPMTWVASYLMRPGPRAVHAVFSRRFARPLGVSCRRKAFAALGSAPSPWARALLYVHAADACDPKWVRALLTELTAVKRVQTTEDLRPLLAGLDADRFADRRAAARALVEVGEAALPALEQARGRPAVSAEAQQGLEWVVRAIRQAPPDSVEEGCLRELAHTLTGPDRQAAAEVLAALAKNEPSLFVSREAKAALRRAGVAASGQ